MGPIRTHLGHLVLHPNRQSGNHSADTGRRQDYRARFVVRYRTISVEPGIGPDVLLPTVHHSSWASPVVEMRQWGLRVFSSNSHCTRMTWGEARPEVWEVRSASPLRTDTSVSATPLAKGTADNCSLFSLCLGAVKRAAGGARSRLSRSRHALVRDCRLMFLQLHL